MESGPYWAWKLHWMRGSWQHEQEQNWRDRRDEEKEQRWRGTQDDDKGDRQQQRQSNKTGEKTGEISPEEGAKKLSRTVAWYNAHGNLQEDILWSRVSAKLCELKYRDANRILSRLEREGSSLPCPTAWILEQCDREMFGIGKLDFKEDSTSRIKAKVAWWNSQGGLSAEGKEIIFEDVREALVDLGPWQATKILQKVGQNKDNISNPTNWILGYAKKLQSQQSQDGVTNMVMPPGLSESSSKSNGSGALTAALQSLTGAVSLRPTAGPTGPRSGDAKTSGNGSTSSTSQNALTSQNAKSEASDSQSLVDRRLAVENMVEEDERKHHGYPGSYPSYPNGQYSKPSWNEGGRVRQDRGKRDDDERRNNWQDRRDDDVRRNAFKDKGKRDDDERRSAWLDRDKCRKEEDQKKNPTQDRSRKDEEDERIGAKTKGRQADDRKKNEKQRNAAEVKPREILEEPRWKGAEESWRRAAEREKAEKSKEETTSRLESLKPLMKDPSRAVPREPLKPASSTSSTKPTSIVSTIGATSAAPKAFTASCTRAEEKSLRAEVANEEGEDDEEEEQEEEDSDADPSSGEADDSPEATHGYTESDFEEMSVETLEGLLQKRGVPILGSFAKAELIKLCCVTEQDSERLAQSDTHGSGNKKDQKDKKAKKDKKRTEDDNEKKVSWQQKVNAEDAQKKTAVAKKHVEAAAKQLQESDSKEVKPDQDLLLSAKQQEFILPEASQKSSATTQVTEVSSHLSEGGATSHRGNQTSAEVFSRPPSRPYVPPQRRTEEASARTADVVAHAAEVAHEIQRPTEPQALSPQRHHFDRDQHFEQFSMEEQFIEAFPQQMAQDRSQNLPQIPRVERPQEPHHAHELSSQAEQCHDLLQHHRHQQEFGRMNSDNFVESFQQPLERPSVSQNHFVGQNQVSQNNSSQLQLARPDLVQMKAPDPPELPLRFVKHSYREEALGYLSLAPGDVVVLMQMAPIEGNQENQYARYVCVQRTLDGTSGWAPEELLWERYLDEGGRPWLYHRPTGDWSWAV